MNSKKLYLVKIRMTGYSGYGRNYETSYVIAENSEIAYRKVLQDLEDKDIGFSIERELDNISLLAENTDYPNCKIKLYT